MVANTKIVVMCEALRQLTVISRFNGFKYLCNFSYSSCYTHMKKLISIIFIVIANIGLAQTSYKLLDECSFSVMIPTSFKITLLDSSPDYCDYEVSKESLKIELNSLNTSRFEYVEIQSLYQEAVKNSKIKISYKVQKSNWFIISGTKDNGNIVYWKRVVGDNFISDLYIEYNSIQKHLIEPHISKMSSSFKSL